MATINSLNGLADITFPDANGGESEPAHFMCVGIGDQTGAALTIEYTGNKSTASFEFSVGVSGNGKETVLTGAEKGVDYPERIIVSTKEAKDQIDRALDPQGFMGFSASVSF